MQRKQHRQGLLMFVRALVGKLRNIGRMQNTGVFMKQTRSLLAAVLAGMAAPASIGAPVEYPRVIGSDLSRLRNDAARVGQDFQAVIKRHGDKKKISRSAKEAV